MHLELHTLQAERILEDAQDEFKWPTPNLTGPCRFGHWRPCIC